jgi:glycosyltransferase involved in cell wall biosynthesis
MQVTIIRGRAIDPAVHKICRCLAQNGYSVRLLVWDRQQNLTDVNTLEYTVDRFNLKAPYDKLSAVFYLPFWWMYVLYYLLKHHADVIHACDFDTLIPAVLAKILKRTKLCYTIYDFYADNLPTRIPAIIRKMVAGAEKYGIGYTDTLFLVDEARYIQVAGANIHNLAYIYNTPPDVHNQCSLATKSARSETENITLFYAGALHEDRGLKRVITAIDEVSDVELILAGVGSITEYLEHIPAENKCRIRYLGWLPYEKVIRHTTKADVLFAFYNPEIPNNRYASPNKLFEAMMCEKPIIVNDNSSMADIVRKERCGIIVPYGNVTAIKHAILTLKSDPALCKRLGENGRKAYETKYSWGIMESRLLKAYRSLLKD